MRQGWMAAALAVVWAACASGMPVPEDVAPPPGDASAAGATVEPERTLRDPFAMRGGDDDGYVGAALSSIPAGIRVVSILSVEGKPSVGALSIPGAKALHFVREGEVIQLDVAGGTAGMPSASQLYLLVNSITDNEIEIAPRARPHDVRVYR